MLSWTKNLQLYLDNSLNVLLEGEGGVGKTAVIKELFNKNFGNDWLYIAGGTCDPFIDLLGIPRPVKDEESGQEVLQFIKPKKLQLNKVKAIFCDEYNRAKKQVMNAMMEIIQFRSLNNEPVPNLKLVWCAINPCDSDYNIEEKLDRSQKDRFHIHINVPYKLPKDYFENKYGADIFSGAEEWWAELPEQAKKEISPRRLDYAIEIWKMNGDLREVLPPSANFSKLLTNLEHGSIASQLEKMLDEPEKDIVKKLEDINIITAIKAKLSDERFMKKFTHLLPDDMISETAPANSKLCEYIKKYSNKFKTSVISALDSMGCFTESDFGPTIVALNKYFPQDTYVSKDRNRMRKVLNYLPDVNKTTIKQTDIPNLQRLLNVVNQYCAKSNWGTVMGDNTKYGEFLRKFRDIKVLNEVQNLGLNIDGAPGNNYRRYYSLQHWINQWDENEKKKLVDALKQQATTQTVTTPQAYVSNNPILRAGQIVVSNNIPVGQAVVNV